MSKTYRLLLFAIFTSANCCAEKDASQILDGEVEVTVKLQDGQEVRVPVKFEAPCSVTVAISENNFKKYLAELFESKKEHIESCLEHVERYKGIYPILISPKGNRYFILKQKLYSNGPRAETCYGWEHLEAVKRVSHYYRAISERQQLTLAEIEEYGYLIDALRSGRRSLFVFGFAGGVMGISAQRAQEYFIDMFPVEILQNLPADTMINPDLTVCTGTDGKKYVLKHDESTIFDRAKKLAGKIFSFFKQK